MSKPLLRLFATVAIALLAPAGQAQYSPLPALNLAIGETSVSGISSGGFMAVQFQMAHASQIKGVGIIAAGPWNCAQNRVHTATTRCSCTASPGSCQVKGDSTDVPALVRATRAAAAKGLMDDPAHLARHRVYTFAGGKDGTVPPAVVSQLGDYYLALGLPREQLNPVVQADAGHTLPTRDYGNACDVSAEPYLGKCGRDAAGDILSWIHGPLKAQSPGAAKGNFIQFDQRPYVPRDRWVWSVGMDESGWLYVPQSCAKGEPCRLHIALHGCRQGQSYLPLKPLPGGGLHYGTTFVNNAGYDRWADANQLVILYPQAVSTWNNPNGCWDWWGYTDGHYADKKGLQIRTLRAMVERLTSGVR